MVTFLKENKHLEDCSSMEEDDASIYTMKDKLVAQMNKVAQATL